MGKRLKITNNSLVKDIYQMYVHKSYIKMCSKGKFIISKIEKIGEIRMNDMYGRILQLID